MALLNDNFQSCLTMFLTHYLPTVCRCSKNTIKSYRDTFLKLFHFYETELNIQPWKLTLDLFSYKNIRQFLFYIESQGASISTQNQRQAALHSFAKYLCFEEPQYIDQLTQIISMPSKNTVKPTISYLKAEQMNLLLSSVSKETKKGFRNYTMMGLMLSCGLRVSELLSMRVKDVSFHLPCTLLVHGKGNKDRIVPLLKPMDSVLHDYLVECNLLQRVPETLIFSNSKGEALSRQTVFDFTRKYAKIAHSHDESFPETLSPHGLRHSCAMSLLEAGVDLIYIRDLLGHSSIRTTEIYAKTDSKKRREAIESAYIELTSELPRWSNNESMLMWLKSF